MGDRFGVDSPDEPVKLWQEKLSFLLQQEACEADPARLFQLRRQIEGVRSRLDELQDLAAVADAPGREATGKGSTAREYVASDLPWSDSRLGAWIFGSTFLIFFLGLFVLGPDNLPPYKRRMLALLSAALAGALGFFLTGSIGLKVRPIESRGGRLRMQAAAGAVLFVLVYIWSQSLWGPFEVTESVYRVRVTVLDLSGQRTSEAEISTSVGELKRVEGGWEIEIPAVKRPPDGRIEIRASQDTTLLAGRAELILEENQFRQQATVLLVEHTPVVISGRVVDGSGQVVEGARVRVIGHPQQTVSDGKGIFILPILAADGQLLVSLHAEKGSLGSVDQRYLVGTDPVTLTLKGVNGSKTESGNEIAEGSDPPADNEMRINKFTTEWGRPISVEIRFSNPFSSVVSGGISVFFSSGVIIQQKDQSARIYYENSRVMARGHQTTIVLSEILVENWYRRWQPKSMNTMRIVFFPINTGRLEVRSRATLLTSVKAKETVSYPTESSCRDPTGYPVLCHSITVKESPALIEWLRLLADEELVNDQEYLRNLRNLLYSRSDSAALAYFGIPDSLDSRELFDSALKAVTDTIADPSIRHSPRLEANIRRIFNDPMDVEALSFLGISPPNWTASPADDSCGSFLADQRGGPALVTLIASEGDISCSCSSKDQVIMLSYQGRSYRFQKRQGVILELTEKIMEIKPRSTFIVEDEPVSSFSYTRLRDALAHEDP